MSAIDTLKNDKDAIIAIISEHFDLHPSEIRDMGFKPFKKHNPNCKNVINHGEWIFCYHRDMGVLYIE